MKHARDLHPRPLPTAENERAEVLQSGFVPARKRGSAEAFMPAVTLRAPRDSVTSFGTELASAGDILLIGGRMAELHPFAALYRLTPEGVRRERVLKGPQGHHGPSLATDGTRIVVGQPALAGGVGFVSVYRLLERELRLEVLLEGKPEDPRSSAFGERVAIGQDLLVLGQAASVCVYRHSAVGWLGAGNLEPELPYAWNPLFGTSLGVVRDLVLVGNPIEINGHRAGPGRAFVYRQQGDQMELVDVLKGEGIEFGRGQERRLGFGAHIEVSGDHVLVTAPYECDGGASRSRVYLYRAQGDGLSLVTSVDVPSCQQGACMVEDRLFALGDALHALVRRGDGFEHLATYDLEREGDTTLAPYGQLLALGAPSREGEVTLRFAAHL